MTQNYTYNKYLKVMHSDLQIVAGENDRKAPTSEDPVPRTLVDDGVEETLNRFCIFIKCVTDLG